MKRGMSDLLVVSVHHGRTHVSWFRPTQILRYSLLGSYSKSVIQPPLFKSCSLYQDL